MALITKGIKFTTTESKNSGVNGLHPIMNVLFDGTEEFEALGNIDENGVFTFPGVQEIGALNMAAGVSNGFDQIEVTTLADHKHVYVDGLKADDSTGSNQITMKFLYHPVLFKAFKNLLEEETRFGEGLSGMNYKDINSIYEIAIPEGGAFELEASIASLAMDSISTNSAVTFTVTFNVAGIDLTV